MYAVIFQIPGRPGVGLLPVAGRPLIARQIQWLCSMGCQKIFVEIDAHEESGRMAEWLGSSDSVGAFTDMTLTTQPAGPEEVARRSGIRRGTPYLAIPADVLGDGDLTLLYRHVEGAGAVAELSPADSMPSSLEGAAVRFFGCGGGLPERIQGPGWGVKIGTMRDALALSIALLTSLPNQEAASASLPIHAALARAGVWIARGARVSEDAEIIGPVLIGADAYVGAGARVGPDVCLGDRTIIEANAVVERAQVLNDCVVIEELPARDCSVTRQGLTSLGSGNLKHGFHTSLGASLKPPRSSAAAARLLALLMLCALLPFSLPLLLGRALRGRPMSVRRVIGRRALWCGATGFGLADFTVALLGVLTGERTLLGVGDTPALPLHASPALLQQALEAPSGAINLEPALSVQGDDPLARLRTLAWYKEAKCRRLDAELFLQLVRSARPGLRSPAPPARATALEPYTSP